MTNNQESLREAIEKLEVPKAVFWVEEGVQVETNRLLNKTVDEILEIFATYTNELIGPDEPQCDCETDPDGLGYHSKWCEQNGLYYGLIRNELRAAQRKRLQDLIKARRG